MTFKQFIGFLALAFMTVFATTAQQKTGRWTNYSSIEQYFTNVVETPEKTYLHSGTALFSLSDDDNESYAYNAFNKLSEREGIYMIRYNAEGKYLFIAYNNGNIDLLYDDGKVVNMAEIKDAVITTSRTINDVEFHNGRIYVATDFGLVVYDDKKHLVIESGIYNTKVNYVFVMSENLVVIAGLDVYAAPLSERHSQLDKFKKVNKLYYNQVAKVNDNLLTYIHTSKAIYTCEYNFETYTGKVTVSNPTNASKLYPCSDGVYALEDGNIALIKSDGTISRVARPEEYSTDELFFNDLSSVWINNTNGLIRCDLSGDTPSILMQAYRPDAITTTQPVQLRWSANNEFLYVSNRSYTFYLNTDGGSKIHKVHAQTSAIHRDGSISDEQPFYIGETTSTAWNNEAKAQNTTRMTGGPCWFAPDPDDPSMYYFTIKAGGIFVVKDGEFYHLINSLNCPNIGQAWAEDIESVEIDPYGNMWVMANIDNQVDPCLFMLPSAKRRDIKNVKREDWQIVKKPSQFYTSHDGHTFFCKKQYGFFTVGGWSTGFCIHDNNNTPYDTSDDRMTFHESVCDQNGNTLSLRFIPDAVEDHNGQLWVATNLGVFVVEKPSSLLASSTPTVTRPIVARNDGTGLGDYLLESEQINKIAVDPSNRKWLASNSSGAYLVSEDGREILAHYNTENSSLPSNCVYSIICDPESNKVYFGTDGGIVAYDSDSSPAADDYSNVYAYPNPVRPEYTGWITIAGLMDNSLVKIADAAGNVLYQAQSEGGMISWDGCDLSGNRVRTGVYYVFASQSTSTTTIGAVAKILVVN